MLIAERGHLFQWAYIPLTTLREEGGILMSVNRKVPLRKCVATGEMHPKKDMIRVVRSKEGEVSVDVTGKKPGRGAYVSKSEKAVDIARKKNVLGHQLEVKIPEQIYEDLLKIIRRESIL